MSSVLTPYLEDYFNYRKGHTTSYLSVSATRNKGFSEHGVRHLVRYLSKTTNVNCHPHRFRHTFAANYYKQTHDLVGLQKLMGHRSFKMTLSYLRSLPDDDLVEQMQKITLDEFV